MAPLCKRKLWKLAFTLALLPILAAGAWGEKQAAHTAPGEEKPVLAIPVGQMGFIPPNPSYLSHRFSFATLDFIDQDHLLFTFHVNKLLPRIPGDPADDDDQLIHAVVLDVVSGKVLRQADWRMHDRGRYLWALRDGEFLVRVRNSLFFTDSSLALKPYLDFETELQGVQVSPARGLLMVEVKRVVPTKTEANGEGNGSAPSLLGPSEGAQREVTEMVLLRPGERKGLAGAKMLNPGTVPLLENGLLDVDEGKKAKEWVIVKKLLGNQRATVATVKSSCTPRLVMLSAHVVLSQGCPVHGGNGDEVRAISLDNGEVLWGDYWQAKYIWPHFKLAEDGSRFGYESLEMNRDIGTMDAFGEDDVVGQPVGVFNTKTGDMVLVKDASPVLSAGQNFALSADGRRFAILRNGAIEVYDLPPVVLATATGKKK